LTDREGSYAQQVLQTLSHKIYNSKGIKVDEKIKEIWKSLPNTDLTLEVDINSLNFFEVPKRLFETLREKLNDLDCPYCGTKLKKSLPQKVFKGHSIRCKYYYTSLARILKF